MIHPSRVEVLELDIDVRLHSLWADLQEFPDPIPHEQVGAFLRASYGKGYVDALAEAEPGELCKQHGYRVPLRGEYRRAA